MNNSDDNFDISMSVNLVTLILTLNANKIHNVV